MTFLAWTALIHWTATAALMAAATYLLMDSDEGTYRRRTSRHIAMMAGITGGAATAYVIANAVNTGGEMNSALWGLPPILAATALASTNNDALHAAACIAAGATAAWYITAQGAANPIAGAMTATAAFTFPMAYLICTARGTMTTPSPRARAAVAGSITALFTYLIAAAFIWHPLAPDGAP